MELITGSILKFRQEEGGYLVYNHSTGSAHLVNQKIFDVLKEYYKSRTSRKAIILRSKDNNELFKILDSLSARNLI